MAKEYIFLPPEQKAIEAIAQRVVELLITSQPDRKQTDSGPEEPISMKVACAIFHVSRPTLHNWKAKGLIPFHRKGRRVYFFKSELLASLEKSRTFNGRRIK